MIFPHFPLVGCVFSRGDSRRFWPSWTCRDSSPGNRRIARLPPGPVFAIDFPEKRLGPDRDAFVYILQYNMYKLL